MADFMHLGALTREAASRDQWRATVVLLTSTPILITWKLFGSMGFYREHLAPAGLVLGSEDYTAAAYLFVTSFLALGVLPALIVKLVLREPLADYGVRLGDLRQGLLALAVVAPLFVTASYFGSQDPGVREFYPLNRDAGRNFTLHALLFFLFYAGWEFHFRGYLQRGLTPTMGRVNATLVQVMASTLMHIGLPISETYLAIPAGILWGGMAIATRSILAGLILHFLLGVTADYFLTYGH